MAEASHLLRLPGELRNRIYDYVFDSLTVLHINRRGRLVPPPITSVCHQLHEEVQASGYLGHSLATRPFIQTLEAHVVDFNFGHVIAFLTRVAEHGLAKAEKLVIRLRLTDAPLQEDLILKWIDFMAAKDECPHTYAIDLGQQTWTSVEVAYDVEMSHESHMGCPCTGVLNGLTALRSHEALVSHWAEIGDELWDAVAISHETFERKREADEADRVLRRSLRSAEREKGHGIAFWLDKMGRTQRDSQDTSTLSSMLNLPPGIEALRTGAHGNGRAGRRTSMTLAGRCHAVRQARLHSRR